MSQWRLNASTEFRKLSIDVLIGRVDIRSRRGEKKMTDILDKLI